MTAGNPGPDADDELSVPERDLVHAAITGTLLDLRSGDPELDDPARGAGWDASRTIRAALLAQLLTRDQPGADTPCRAVKLRGARITGQLDLEAAALTCPLLLGDCYIGEPVSFREAAASSIRMPGCHLPALTAEQLRTTGSLELNDGFTTHGEVRLRGARIGGQLDLSGARLANPGGRALVADGLTAEQGMFCCDGFTAEGEVRLHGTHIGGPLELNGAHLANPGGESLIADGLTVEQDMYCREGFTAEGELRLPRGSIGGELNMDGARLTNEHGRALSADQLTVGQDMSCCDGFTVKGEVRLRGAHIGGVLDLSGACLSNRDGRALHAERLIVERDMFCREGFTAEGELRLAGARIGGELDLGGAHLINPGRWSLDLEEADVAALVLLPARCLDAVDLANARVGSFRDDPASWSWLPMSLVLQGFVYDRLENDRMKVRERLIWLQLDVGGYIPQAYDQLAAAYRSAGREEAARKVAIGKQWRRRTVLNPAGKLLNWLLYVTVGYGYRTWLAGAWLAGLLIASIAVFSNIRMAATTAHPASFNPLGYTIDVLVPFADLSLKNDWQPSGGYLYLAWALRGIGWVLTTAVVAAVTGVIRRD
jgi:hypothetical protein